MELEVLRLEEEAERKRREDLERRAAEISWRKVERSYAAQEEHWKEQEARNAEAGSSRVTAEAPCWECVRRKQECERQG